MGLLDGVLGKVLGGAMGGGSAPGGNRQNDNPLGSLLGGLGGLGGAGIGGGALMTMALQLLQQSGGISGVVEKFRASGLGAQADSWVGTGENMPVSADQVSSVLGAGALGQLASRLGLSTDQASSGLAQVLPELVNKMTPGGQVPENHHDMISEALAMLTPKTSA